MDTNIIVAFITGVIGPVGLYLITNYLPKKEKKDIVSEAIKTSKEVNTKLEDIKERYNADRVWIIQFHNGGNYYPTGKSIAKFSMNYETLNIGTSSVQASLQNIPVSLCSYTLNELYINDIINIDNNNSGDIAKYGLSNLVSILNGKSTLMFALKSIDHRLIGVMGIDYIIEESKLTDKEVNNLQIESGIIGGVLMNYLVN